MSYKDRIVGLRRVKASTLHPHPLNWRSHPKAQRAALQGILSEIGYADALIARELPDKSLQLIDGHLRAETTPNQEVPVLVLDVTEEEANMLLVSLDPLAAMARSDSDNLEALLADVKTDDDALKRMIGNLARHAGIDTGEPLEDDDAVTLPADPVTKRGDLWLLGEHRLLCGNSTSRDDVQA